MGEHLGSPLPFPYLELVLLFDIFIIFILVGADLGVCPILCPSPARFLLLSLSLSPSLVTIFPESGEYMMGEHLGSPLHSLNRYFSRKVYNIGGKVRQPRVNKPEESPNSTEQGTG